jgi:uncharacterized membrane protein
MFYDDVTRPRVIWVAALIFCIVVFVDSWFRWSTFQYATFDIAFYTQAFWLALHGKWHASLLDVSLMGNHQEPIAFLILPFFKIWSSPMLLVLIQTLMLATMPFTGWRIARRLEFGPQASLWLALTTLLAPATGFIALHEFHPEALAAPLILLMLEARLKRRPGLFWLWFLLVLACKENMALLLAWMCAVHFILERERGREWQAQWNVVPGVLALIWLLLCSLVIRPMLNRGNVDYLELYSHLGKSGGTILVGFLAHPAAAIGAFWRGLTGGNLVWGLLAPFLLLPLLKPRWLIVAAPIFAQHLLSWRPSEWSIQYHYAAPLLPLVWFAAAEAASSLFWRDVLAGWMAVACAVCQLWFGPAVRVWGTVAGAKDALWARDWKREMLEAIPADASVTAGLPYLSHLAGREKLYSLHHIVKGLQTLSRKKFIPPGATDAVVVDTADLATFSRADGYFHPRMRTVANEIVPSSDMLLHDFLRRAEWRKLARNEFTLFLREPSKLAETTDAQGRKLDDHHTLLGIQGMPPLPGDSMLFRMSWELQAGRQSLLWATLYLRNENGRLFAIGKGPVAPEVESGPLTEAWAVRPPPSLKPGKYRGLILVYDPFESDVPKEQQRFQRVTFDVGEFSLQ